jgi:cytochrome oxidase Cu insertion factor (SCO1/SenC/PrrC family)
MSNKLMAQPQVEATPAEFRRRFRRTWIISGFVMWGLVIAVAIVLLVIHHKERAAPSADDSDAVVLAGQPIRDADQKGVPGEAAGTTQPSSPWSSAGIEDFVFTERSGRKITKADLLGHPWLISFIFTRCAGPCPRVSGQMSELQTLLKGTDVRLVTLTVDPDFDTTDVLTHYAQTYHADPGRWLYLTGDKRKTYRLINNSFLMPVQEYTGKDREPGFEVMHSTNILLVNEKGVVINKYNALADVDMARLRRDLKPYLDAKRPPVQDQGTKQPATPGKGNPH